MTTKLLRGVSLLALMFLFFYNLANAASCHPYMEQLSNGSMKYSVTFANSQAYVEVFVRQNGIQNVATNIVSSQVANANGTYSYSYTSPASNFVNGDNLITRFYSYRAGQPGVFTPGPAESVWSSSFIYNQSCKVSVIYVSVTGSDANAGTQASPVRTIKYGYNLAKQKAASEVRVATGVYNEGTFSTFDYSHIYLANGISLLGGYSPDFTTRDLTFTTYTSRLVGPNGGTQQAGPRMIIADNITTSTIIEGLEISKGVSQSIGGGIYVKNSNANLIIRNNRLVDNYASYMGKGGNIALENSSSKVLNNIIIEGFSGSGANGSDSYMVGTYAGVKAEVAYNLFSSPSTVLGADQANFHDNSYMSEIVFVSVLGDDTFAGTIAKPVKTVARGIALAQTKTAKQVRVSAGVYYENMISPVTGISLLGGYATSFIARDLTHTIYKTEINGSNYATVVYLQGVHHILIEGFRITNGGSSLGSNNKGGGIFADNVYQVEIKNNLIEKSYANTVGGNVHIEYSEVLLHDNAIVNGMTHGPSDLYNNGSYFGITPSQIYNNVFTRPSSVYNNGGVFYNNTYLFAARMAQVDATEVMDNGIQLNITNDILSVEGNQGNITVQVIDLNGKTFVTSDRNEVSLRELNNGYYIIRVADGKNVVAKKVLLQD